MSPTALSKRQNHFNEDLLYVSKRQTSAFLFLLAKSTSATIETMAHHSRALFIGVLMSALALTNCAKKHHAARRLPSPPQIQGVETGLASWYGHPYHGRPAADGEIYDMERLTAAHRTLPFGTLVRVTNLTNEKTVDVRIIDRGPFIDGRIIDLSHAAAVAIDLIGPGVTQVRLDVLSAPPPAPADSLFAVQAGAFVDKSRAERLCLLLDGEYGPVRLVARAGSPSLWRVLVGSEPTEDTAKTLASKIRHEVGNAFVVRLDASAVAASAHVVTSTNP